MRHLIDPLDFSVEEIDSLLHLACLLYTSSCGLILLELDDLQYLFMVKHGELFAIIPPRKTLSLRQRKYLLSPTIWKG